jgi:hypothetical protein
MLLNTTEPVDLKAGIYSIEVVWAEGTVDVTVSQDGLAFVAIDGLSGLTASTVKSVALPKCQMKSTLAGANAVSVKLVG